MNPDASRFALFQVFRRQRYHRGVCSRGCLVEAQRAPSGKRQPPVVGAGRPEVREGADATLATGVMPGREPSPRGRRTQPPIRSPPQGRASTSQPPPGVPVTTPDPDADETDPPKLRALRRMRDGSSDRVKTAASREQPLHGAAPAPAPLTGGAQAVEPGVDATWPRTRDGKGPGPLSRGAAAGHSALRRGASAPWNPVSREGGHPQGSDRSASAVKRPARAPGSRGDGRTLGHAPPHKAPFSSLLPTSSSSARRGASGA